LFWVFMAVSLPFTARTSASDDRRTKSTDPRRYPRAARVSRAFVSLSVSASGSVSDESSV
jgi:predicted secreted protein